jgi:hypothetical protein
MHRRVVHGPRTAGRADTSILAGERDQQIVSAGAAVHAREAVRQDPAVQVSLELLAHEAGQSEAGRAALLGLD